MCLKLLRVNLIKLQSLFVCDLHNKFKSVTNPRYKYSDTICRISPEGKTHGLTLELLLDLVKNIVTVLEINRFKASHVEVLTLNPGCFTLCFENIQCMEVMAREQNHILCKKQRSDPEVHKPDYVSGSWICDEGQPWWGPVWKRAQLEWRHSACSGSTEQATLGSSIPTETGF
ncbi:hypothetical protein ILYODFUR_038112 [Ilyodon furcidens]|uniref:Uncharacterized protein n=1 Tax=Ilyodon furcidens TaxID=33524 RepID=A0ABV0U2W2_9TELE